MKHSHSRVELFETCPMKFKYRYIDELETLPSDDPQSPLILGTAVHHAIETTIPQAIKEYFNAYPVITDKHINEAIKIEKLIPIVKAMLPRGKFEIPIQCDGFTGFIDMMDEQGNIYDFKYSNNTEHYMQSRQLHLYKYYYEKQTGKHVPHLYFVFIPKVMIKQKKTESIYQFRQRLMERLATERPIIREVTYCEEKVEMHLQLVKKIESTTTFEKNETRLCDWCEFKEWCKKGENFMLLPSTTRRSLDKPVKTKTWIYGAPYSGKTTMLDSAPNPLNLNTDGNIEFVTMPFISIKDEVTMDGRIARRTFAWQVFKDAILELEKKQNQFETIIIDLVEDTREMCRLYMYDKLNIEHESDSGYGKGWDIIKTEYLSTMRRFFNLDYKNLVIVSHELISEVNLKNGQKITKIMPNIQEAIANKIAGMVDIVARVVIEDDGTRTLNFKSDEYVFGGGRLKGITTTKIPLSWDALMNVYDQALKNSRPHVEMAQESTTPEPVIVTHVDPIPPDQPAPQEDQTPQEVPADTKPVRRTRRVRTGE